MRWFVFRSGTPEGPFEEQALVEMIRSGQVGAQAQVCPEGGNAWQAVGSHPPFAQAQAQQQEHASMPKTQPLSAEQLGQVTGGGGGSGFAPPAGGAAPPQKKSKLPLIIGGGCGLLVVLTLCVGGGIFAYFEMRGSAFADATHEVADDIVAAAEGRSGDVSATWSAPFGEESLKDTPPSEREELNALTGEPETVLTGVSMAAHAGGRVVRTVVVVFPDGTVRYSALKANDYPADILGPPTGMPRDNDTLSNLVGGVDDFLDLAANDCEGLELVTSDELEGLPAELRQDILKDTSEGAREEVCSEVTTQGRTAFTTTRVDGVVVLRQGEAGTVAGLQTRFESPDGNPMDVFLSPVRVKIFD